MMPYAEATDFVIASIERAQRRAEASGDDRGRPRRAERVQMSDGRSHAPGMSALMGMAGMLLSR